MRSSLRLLTTIKPGSKSATSISHAQKSPKPQLTLEHFLIRQRVLSLYRSIVRAIYSIPSDQRAEPLRYAKGEFERNWHVTDVGQIRYLVSTGKTEFDGLRRIFDELAVKKKPKTE
jgi:hypothetical protein